MTTHRTARARARLIRPLSICDDHPPGTVRWAKLDPFAIAHGPYGFRTAPATFVRLRLWWPLYLPPHRDPQLGGVGRMLHYHVAWNRIPRTAERFGRVHAANVAHHAWIGRWGRFDRSEPAGEHPSLPAQHAGLPATLERTLMGREGPFEATADGRCPHRGCPLDEFLPADADGVRQCPWHLIRVRNRR